jgi:hypothetical protein
LRRGAITGTQGARHEMKWNEMSFPEKSFCKLWIFHVCLVPLESSWRGTVDKTENIYHNAHGISIPLKEPLLWDSYSNLNHLSSGVATWGQFPTVNAGLHIFRSKETMFFSLEDFECWLKIVLFISPATRDSIFADQIQCCPILCQLNGMTSPFLWLIPPVFPGCFSHMPSRLTSSVSSCPPAVAGTPATLQAKPE